MTKISCPLPPLLGKNQGRKETGKKQKEAVDRKGKEKKNLFLASFPLAKLHDLSYAQMSVQIDPLPPFTSHICHAWMLESPRPNSFSFTFFIIIIIFFFFLPLARNFPQQGKFYPYLKESVCVAFPRRLFPGISRHPLPFPSG